jgi:hypothetical protein
MVNEGICHLATEFKTADKYEFQPITIVEWLRPYLGVWLTSLRPAILRENPTLAERLKMPDSPLFLRHCGTTIDASGFIATFFNKHGLRTTSNILRSDHAPILRYLFCKNCN